MSFYYCLIDCRLYKTLNEETQGFLKNWFDLYVSQLTCVSSTSTFILSGIYTEKEKTKIMN